MKCEGCRRVNILALTSCKIKIPKDTDDVKLKEWWLGNNTKLKQEETQTMVTLLCEMKQQKEQKLGNIAKPQHNKTQIMLTEFCPVLTWRANTLDLLLQDELAELEVVPRLKVQRIHRPNRPGQYLALCFYCCGCCLVWNCACPTMSWPDSI